MANQLITFADLLYEAQKVFKQECDRYQKMVDSNLFIDYQMNWERPEFDMDWKPS